MEPARTDIALKELAVVQWTRGQRPVWVQLGVPRLEDEHQALFEGSVSPWEQTRAPTIDWSAVDPLLERVGLAPSSLDRDEHRLLRSLPFLYWRGVARTAREVWGRQPGGDLCFFPSVAFQPIKPEKEDDPPSFWTVRMTVAVIRNVVVTVRLPDLRSSGDDGEFLYQPGEQLVVAERFFHPVDDLTAHDVAEAIALQHASTARAVTYEVRTKLTKIERTWRMHDASVKKSNRGDARAGMQRVISMTDSVFQLERQIERLLRRIEPSGASHSESAAPSELALRYRFALDELRSLEGNASLASDALRHAITTGEQEERERVQVVAGVLATAFLVPTLVVGLYGAKVPVPLQDTHPGFIALIVFIAACGIASLIVLRLRRHREVRRSTSSALPGRSSP